MQNNKKIFWGKKTGIFALNEESKLIRKSHFYWGILVKRGRSGREGFGRKTQNRTRFLLIPYSHTCLTKIKTLPYGLPVPKHLIFLLLHFQQAIDCFFWWWQRPTNDKRKKHRDVSSSPANFS
jgi:hypothetical protein